MDSHKFEDWPQIAGEVNNLIRENGREQFCIQTQQAASDYVAACKDFESREKQRLNLLEKNGVLEGVENRPDPPDDNWVVWEKTVRGSLKVPKDFEPPSMQPQLPDVPDEIRGLLPTRNFTDQEYTAWIPYKKEFDAWRRVNNDSRKARLDVVRLVKERGFPNDTQCDYVYKYMFNLLCLIPDELSPDDDPKNRDWPLPVRRELTLAEKFAVLSAVHAAHWKGAPTIEPWGPKLSDVSKDQFPQASWYDILVYKAKELDVLDVLDVDQLRFVGDLLADVKSELLKGKSESARRAKQANGEPKRVNKSKSDNDALFVASLNKHHEYENGSVLKFEPIALESTGISKAAASRRFEKHFGSYSIYAQQCIGERIAQALKIINGEISPKLLNENVQIDETRSTVPPKKRNG